MYSIHKAIRKRNARCGAYSVDGKNAGVFIAVEVHGFRVVRRHCYQWKRRGVGKDQLLTVVVGGGVKKMKISGAEAEVQFP